MSKKNQNLRNDNSSSIIFAIISLLIIFSLIGVGFWLLTKDSNQSNQSVTDINTLPLENDKQIINITAKGGYSPNFVVARSNTKTILRMTTKNSYDCSSVFYIKSLNISKTLPANAVTDIVIPAQSSGTLINGTCAMGMYQFKIKFS